MPVIAILTLLAVSLFGVKSLVIFSSRNGLFGHLEKLVGTEHAPSGRPLRPWTTHGRFPKVDLQIRAVCVFFLLYCEDWSIPETSLAGVSFVGAWGSSWALVMLDSLRIYSEQSLMSWITIPGIIIFNYSHAIFMPLYLAYRLAFTPSPTSENLLLDPIDAKVFPWTWALSYGVPILMCCMPSVTFWGVNVKHTACGFYQQWNVYISLCQYGLAVLFRKISESPSDHSPVETLALMRNVYGSIFVMAAVAHWIPILVALGAAAWPLMSGKKQSSIVPKKILWPANPFSDQKAASASEGGRWLIQWDVITGTTATIVWAAYLYLQAHESLALTMPWLEMAKRSFWPALVGGPMGIPVALLWWRDELIVNSRLGAL